MILKNEKFTIIKVYIKNRKKPIEYCVLASEGGDFIKRLSNDINSRVFVKIGHTVVNSNEIQFIAEGE